LEFFGSPEWGSSSWNGRVGRVHIFDSELSLKKINFVRAIELQIYYPATEGQIAQEAARNFLNPKWEL
jgi:hypothetical protein